jgi:hypothetical protein
MGCGKNVAVRSVEPFIWGDSGSVLIKSIKLVLSYDPVKSSVETKVSNDKTTESLLSWRGRLFTLEDLYTIDLKTQKRFKSPGLQAKFSISEHDQFIDLLDSEALLSKIKEIHGKGLETLKSNILINSIKQDCKELWNFMKDFWGKHKAQADKTDLLHFRKECLTMTVEKKTDAGKLQQFLESKYKASTFRRLKKNLKAKAIIEKNSQRPHLVKIRKSLLIDFSVGVQHLMELEEEVKVYIFCWPDVPELDDDHFFQREAEKMRNGCKVVYNDIHQEIEMFQ